MRAKIDLATWKHLAEAALAQADGDPDDWYQLPLLEEFLIVEETKANGPFIAASSPARVKALIEALEVARRDFNSIIEHAYLAEDEVEYAIKTAVAAQARIAELLGEK